MRTSCWSACGRARRRAWRLSLAWINAPRLAAGAPAYVAARLGRRRRAAAARSTASASRRSCCSPSAARCTPSAPRSTRCSSPNLWPRTFGFHEVFHALVIAAAARALHRDGGLGRAERRSAEQTPGAPAARARRRRRAARIRHPLVAEQLRRRPRARTSGRMPPTRARKNASSPAIRRPRPTGSRAAAITGPASSAATRPASSRSSRRGGLLPRLPRARARLPAAPTARGRRRDRASAGAAPRGPRGRCTRAAGRPATIGSHIVAITAVELRLAEVLGAFSYALDLGEGQAAGHALRTLPDRDGARASARGLDADQRSRPLLRAPAQGRRLLEQRLAHRRAARSRRPGRQARAQAHGLDALTGALPLGRCGSSRRYDAPARARARRLAVLARGRDASGEFTRLRCERGAEIAAGPRLPAGHGGRDLLARRALGRQRASATGSRGEEIPLLARIMCLAQTVEVFAHRARRRGRRSPSRGGGAARWFDPALVDAARRASCCATSRPSTTTLARGASPRTSRPSACCSPTRRSSTGSRTRSPR